MNERSRIHAFIDECGQQVVSPKSSSYFLIGALIVGDDHVDELKSFVGRLKVRVKRRPEDRLHFRKLRAPDHRAFVISSLGQCRRAELCVVAMSKRDFTANLGTDRKRVHNYTMRLLLERLSWCARDRNAVMTLTISHVKHFRREEFTSYMTILRTQDTSIAWDHIDVDSAQFVQDINEPLLQAADCVVSATAKYFENPSDRASTAEYLQALCPRFYGFDKKRGDELPTGLKVFPKTAITATGVNTLDFLFPGRQSNDKG